MRVTSEVKALVAAQLKDSIAAAEAHFDTTFKMPNILYTKRGTTAGTANYRRYEVNFNAVLLMENVEDFLARTVRHEMAHLIDHKLNPGNFESTLQRTHRGWKRTKRDVHGVSWKNIMRVLGAPVSRCHKYDVTNSRVKRAAQAKHLYTCNTCQTEMKLGPVRHRKMASGKALYWMKTCRDHGGYSYRGLERAAAPQALAAETVAPAPANTTKPTSKLARCRMIYDWTESRQWNINQFVAEADCTTAGAATYYAKIKKGG